MLIASFVLSAHHPHLYSYSYAKHDKYCLQATSVKGVSLAKAKLGVYAFDPQPLIPPDARPPPIIYQGPQNQTLPIGADAILRCMSAADPRPSISWYKEDSELDMSSDSRITQRGSGSLLISSRSTLLKHIGFVLHSFLM